MELVVLSAMQLQIGVKKLRTGEGQLYLSTTVLWSTICRSHADQLQ